MIKLENSPSFSAVFLRLDSDTVGLFVDEVTTLLEKKTPFEMLGEYDNGIFSRKPEPLQGVILFSIHDDESLEKLDKSISLKLDEDSWAFVLSLIERHQNGVEFSPEIAEIGLKGSKRDRDIDLVLML